jgi:hypothetical protein
MAAGTVALPDGFIPDEPAAPQGSSLPDGFVMDQPGGAQTAPQSFTDKVANLWEHPPAGPSLIGMARGLYDSVMTPGRTMQAATDQANKTQITDSDIPITSQTLAAPAMNMAQNILLPTPGNAINVLPKMAEKPTYGTNFAQRKATDIVTAPLKDAGMATPQAVESALTKIGPEATLADLDPRLTQMAGTIAAKPGPGQQTLRGALESRNAGASDRIISAADAAMGKPVDLEATGQAIYSAAKKSAGPLYNEAYGAALPVASEDMSAVLSSPFGKQAVSKARQMALSDTAGPESQMLSKQPTQAPAQAPLPDWAQGVIAKGGPAADRLTAALEKSGVIQKAPEPTPPDVRGLHLIRQSYDDMINAAQRQGNANKARVLQAQRSIIDEQLKSVEPFKQADSIYSDMSRIREAMQGGLNAFKNNQTPQDVAAAMNGMSQAERAAFQQGARAAVRGTMGTARNDAAAARAMFSKDFNQEKLAAILGKDEADKLLGRVSAEATYANTDQRVLRNSETAARAYGKDALEGAHGFPDVLSTLNYSGLHSIPRHLILRGVNAALNSAKTSQQQAVEAEVAKLLSLGQSNRAQTLAALYGQGGKPAQLNTPLLPLALQAALAPNVAQK